MMSPTNTPTPTTTTTTTTFVFCHYHYHYHYHHYHYHYHYTFVLMMSPTTTTTTTTNNWLQFLPPCGVLSHADLIFCRPARCFHMLASFFAALRGVFTCWFHFHR